MDNEKKPSVFEGVGPFETRLTIHWFDRSGKMIQGFG